MKQLQRLIAALLVIAGISPAIAQTFPTVPSGTVIGRTAIGTGPAQAIPITTLIASMLNPLTVTSVNTASVIYRGSTSGTATVSAQAVAGTPVIKWPTTSGTVPTTATLPIVLDSVTGNLTCPTCMLSLATRTAAAALDLSAYSVVRTMGYSTAGDGGEAIFTKIAGNFIDTRILTGTISNTGTSGCTNGTYNGRSFSGGSGRGAVGTVTVAGNVVTAVSMGGQSTAGYIVGDVLTASPNITGCASTVAWTVSTITTPTGSFTDSAGNKWQINYPTEGLNIKAMGVKFDWDGTDGTATDNFTTIQNALSFASYPTSTIVDLGGSLGGQVNLPKNTAMFCGGGTAALVVPYGVKVKGQGNYTSVLKPCDTWGVSVNVIELCDKNTHLAGFGCMLEDFQVFMQRDVSSNANISLIYSNNAQHDAGMRRMVLYPGACRRGLTLETGYGGATLVTMENLEFKGGKAAASCGGNANPMISVNYGTTWVYFTNLNMGGLSASFSGPRDNGLVITGGFVVLEGIHPEQIISPVTINIAGGLSNGQVRARMVTGGVDCVGMFALAATNTPGNFMLGPPNAVNGCTRLVTNGQPAGSNLTGPVMIDTIFNP
jgi:hypothetical protein